jgi:hypothetical protein
MRRGHSAEIKVQVLDCAAGGPADQKKKLVMAKKCWGKKMDKRMAAGFDFFAQPFFCLFQYSTSQETETGREPVRVCSEKRNYPAAATNNHRFQSTRFLDNELDFYRNKCSGLIKVVFKRIALVTIQFIKQKEQSLDVPNRRAKGWAFLSGSLTPVLNLQSMFTSFNLILGGSDQFELFVCS